MILDRNLEFADARAADGVAANALFGDVIDLDTAGRDLIDTLYLVINVSTAFTGGTSAQFDLRTSSTENLATAPITLATTGAIPVASLPRGAVFIIPLPRGLFERYAGIWLTRVGTISAGAVNAFLTTDVPNWKAYADAQN